MWCAIDFKYGVRMRWKNFKKKKKKKSEKNKTNKLSATAKYPKISQKMFRLIYRSAIIK